jgi:hypothetical protein
MDLKAIRFVPGTKISHDYEGKTINTFGYAELIGKGIQCIGVPARPNGLIIIDVDAGGTSPTAHKHDGREWWLNFAKEKNLTPTYTVATQSGGNHFYYKLPLHIDPVHFSPPARLAPGVDVVYNGWVAAPPSPGYSIVWGSTEQIQDCPEEILEHIADLKRNPHANKENESSDISSFVNVHRPFTPEQLKDLKAKIEWMQVNGKLSYSEWRDGLFALKAGVDDDEVLADLADAWTRNQSFMPGDETKAQEIIARSSRYGSVGPGTIFALIKEQMMRSGAVNAQSPFSIQEIYDRANVPLSFDKEGKVNVIASETNVAALIGSIFDSETLYHDIRLDLYMFKGKPVSDTDLANTLSPIIQSVQHGMGLQKIKKSSISGGLDVLLAARRIDPHRRYLENLKWDRIPRINDFFHKYFGVESTEYVSAVSKNMWIMLAARGVNPGCKVDNVIIFEGHEGINKSTLIKVLAGEYTYSPTNPALFRDPEELRKMHQSVIVELPELIGLKGQDESLVKGFVTNTEDLIRQLYARKAIKSQRGFIMIGTTNEGNYLTEDMGVRRFWPIKIPVGKKINTNAIATDRDQLFAEAVHRYKEGEVFYTVPEELHEAVVRSKTRVEALAGAVQSFVATDLRPAWRIDEVYSYLVGHGYLPKNLSASVFNRIERALRYCGCEEISRPMEHAIWRRKSTPSLDLATFF